MKLRANGIDIHYELTGPESAPVLTFSHSLMANLEMWDPQMAAVAGFQVLRYDTRGHGKSEATSGPYDLELLATDARSLLDMLGIDSTTFVGLSLGGMIGQELAIRYPECVDRLVLCDTRSHSPPERSQSRADRIALAKEQGIEPMVERALDGWFSDDYRQSNAHVMAAMRKMIRSTSVAGLIGCTGAIDGQEHTSQLDKIKVPTLIIVGADDPSTPVSQAEIMRDGITDSRLVVLPESRHLSNVESANQFNQALLEFLH